MLAADREKHAILYFSSVNTNFEKRTVCRSSLQQQEAKELIVGSSLLHGRLCSFVGERHDARLRRNEVRGVPVCRTAHNVTCYISVDVFLKPWFATQTHTARALRRWLRPLHGIGIARGAKGQSLASEHERTELKKCKEKKQEG